MPDLTEIVAALAQKTQDKKLTWEINDDGTIWVNLGSNSIEIASGRGPFSGFTVRVLNLAGDAVDSKNYASSSPTYDELSEIYRSGRRQALKTDEVLTDILNQLNRI